MYQLEWTHSLNTGIEVIDADHKQLLSLINQLSAAIESQQPAQTITEIFDRLEGYVGEHFGREEQLLRQCHYPDIATHIHSHRNFSKKIQKLKQQLSTNSPHKAAEEAIEYLFDWLITHILEEDLRYLPAVTAQQLRDRSTAPHESLINRFARWMSSHLSLYNRVLLAILLPIVALTFLSVLTISNSARQVAALNTHKALFAWAGHMEELISSLQAERGLTTGLIGSDYRRFQPELIAQRLHSDRAAMQLESERQSLSATISDRSLAPHFVQLNSDLGRLPGLRQQIDAQLSTADEMNTYYSQLIEDLLRLTNRVVQYQQGSALNNHILALGALMRLKEAVGQERALGTLAIEQGALAGERWRAFIQITGKQQGAAGLFEQVADPATAALWQTLNNSDTALAFRAQEAQFLNAVEAGTLSTLDSYAWFELLSKKMATLQDLIMQLSTNLPQESALITKELKWQIYSTATLLLVLLLLAVVLSRALTQSIALPITRLTRAMTSLASGNRNIRLHEKLANDVLGEVVAAYEHCRLGLQQADLATLTQQLKERQREQQQKRTATDPLTGACNRRQFNSLATAQLQHSRLHHSPLSMLMIDLDHFENINDSYGHSSGDLVLKTFAQHCRSLLPSSAIIARWGGEEFAILLPDTELAAALSRAEQLRETIKTMEISLEGLEGHSTPVTLSIGVAQWRDEDNQTLNGLITQADTALGVAKSDGKDRVRAYQNPEAVKHVEAAAPSYS